MKRRISTVLALALLAGCADVQSRGLDLAQSGQRQLRHGNPDADLSGRRRAVLP
jgi:hypothetical protein